MAKKFSFNEWIESNHLKSETAEELKKQDFDGEEALRLLDSSDLAALEITRGQRKLLEKAIHDLTGVSTKTTMKDHQQPITTSSLAKDTGLNSLLQQLETDGGLDAIINGSIEDHGAAKQKTHEMGATARLDTDPQVFLGPNKPKGTTDPPLLIPDYVQSYGYGQDDFEEHELTSAPQQRVVVRTARAKPKLEKITLAMWVGANSKIMHKLIQKGTLSSPSDIQDFLSYTVKVSELLESYTLISVLHYDDQYRKLQHEYKFRWGSDSQHLHTRFLKRRERPNLSNRTSASGTATHSSFVSPTAAPICRQFNSALGCQWPNCRFAHICIVKGCGKPHSQTKHTPSPPSPLGNMYAPTF